MARHTLAITRGTSMTQRTATIASTAGLHARPAAVFARAAADSAHDVSLSTNGQTVDGHSLLSIITLGIAHGDEVVIDVAGEDAGRVADELAALLSSDLDAH